MKKTANLLLPHLFVGVPLLQIFIIIGGLPDWELPVTDPKWWLPMTLLLWLIVHTSMAIFFGISKTANRWFLPLATVVFLALWSPILLRDWQLWEGHFLSTHFWGQPFFLLLFLLMLPAGYALNALIRESLYGTKRIPFGFDAFLFVSVVVGAFAMWRISEILRPEADIFIEVFFFTGVMAMLCLLWILGRAGYRIANNENNLFLHHIPRVLFGLVAPLIGLRIHMEVNLYGNLNTPLIWVAAVVTGLAVWLPVGDRQGRNWAHLIALMIGLPYTLYFAVLFTPLLPFAIPLILYFGLGLLLLAPLLLLLLQLSHIRKLLQKLKTQNSVWRLVVVCSLALMALPMAIDLQFRRDANILKHATQHLIQPDYDTHDTALPHPNAIRRALKNAEVWQGNNRGLLTNTSTPLLSNWYRVRALGGYALSRQLNASLQEVFLPEYKKADLNPRSEIPNCCATPKVAAKSVFDSTRNLWVSDIHLELEQNEQWYNEYKTAFSLPDGAYITDYYLDVFGVRKWGLLTERYAAQWIYQTIRNTKRDPGLLFYEADNQLVLRVFPFSKGEVRKTGFQITHAAPFSFQLANHQLPLGDTTHATTAGQIIEQNDFAYIPVNHKKGLPTTHRSPYLHMLLDYSAASTEEAASRVSYYRGEIEKLQAAYPEIPIRITPVNHNPAPSMPLEAWLAIGTDNGPFTGNAFWQRGFEQALYDHYQSKSATRPVFLALHYGQAYPNWKAPINWSFTAPDVGVVFHKFQDQEWVPFRLLNTLQQPKTLDAALQPVATPTWTDNKGKQYFLPDDTHGSLVVKTHYPTVETLPSDPWLAGLALHAWSRAAVLQPQHGNQHWVAQLQQNLQVRTLSSITAFIVVETEEQEKQLLNKQAEMLRNGRRNQSTDSYLGMSVSKLGVVFLLVLVIFCWRLLLVWRIES